MPDVVPEPALGRWVVAGTSAHPRRMWVPEEQAPAEPAQREVLVD